jgi:hypothetical protein
MNLLDITAIILSIFAFLATLRKKEYGKFYFVKNKGENKDLLFKLIKSDVFEVKIQPDLSKDSGLRLILLDPNFLDEKNVNFTSYEDKNFEFGSIKNGTLLKVSGQNIKSLQITFKDKYNNKFSQVITKNNISKRSHNNIWNLTFIGS